MRCPWWRQPLLLAFLLGCTVSAAASGRFSVRLIVDGALSFAFIPIIEVAALALVYRTGVRPLPFARAVEPFFAGNAPWLLWLVAVSALSCLSRPAYWPPSALEASLCPVAAWSALVDYRFFRGVTGRPPNGAVKDLVLCRAIAWSASIAYFFGIAIWSETLPELVAWVGL